MALYGELLKIAGGKERMSHYFKHHGLARWRQRPAIMTR